MCNLSINKLCKALHDPSINPANAAKKGYEYIDDVIYDLSNPSDAMQDILLFCREFHCKLGTANIEKENFYGLYMPTKKIS